MTKETLERLLNDACELLTQLEYYADLEQVKKIDALFSEIYDSDDIEYEMSNMDADTEAQDWSKFGEHKI